MTTVVLNNVKSIILRGAQRPQGGAKVATVANFHTSNCPTAKRVLPPSEYIMTPVGKVYHIFKDCCGGKDYRKCLLTFVAHNDHRGASKLLYFSNFCSATLRKND